MQKTFSFQGAGEIHFGCGLINQLPDLSIRYGSGPVLLVMDPFSWPGVVSKFAFLMT